MIERWSATSFPGTKSITKYMSDELLSVSIFIIVLFQISALVGLHYYAKSLFSFVIEWSNHKNEGHKIYISEDWIASNDLPDGVDYKDITDDGILYIILFQTFAYLQIFNTLNARRPSYKDLNPLKGISIGTVVCLVFMLALQFSFAYLPLIAGYGSISTYPNLLCMAVGASSVLWFILCKIFMRLIVSTNNPERRALVLHDSI